MYLQYNFFLHGVYTTLTCTTSNTYITEYNNGRQIELQLIYLQVIVCMLIVRVTNTEFCLVNYTT